MMRPHSLHKNFGRHQAGFTLVELMVSITIGLIMLAALVTLIADQSGNREEIDRSGKMIENGRYAIQTMAADVQMAGFWGEYNPPESTAALLPDPCSTALVADSDPDPVPARGPSLRKALAFHVQGYNDLMALPASLDCVSNHKAGTDILVVRRADVETVAVAALTNDDDNQVFIQSGLRAPVGSDFLHVIDTGGNAASFIYQKKNLTTAADLRKVLVHIYYISECSVPVGGSCTNADGGTPIPTLKRVELTKGNSGPEFKTESLAEGIENLQIDYGSDSDTDGSPDGADVNGSALTPAQWQGVMSMKLYLLARSLERTPGFQDTKSYVLGTAGAASAPSGSTDYKRHVFVQSIRLVNPSGRRKF